MIACYRRIINESKLFNGLDTTNGLDDSSVLMSPDRSYLPPPPVNSPVTNIPGWFNTTTTGNGDSSAIFSWSRTDDDETSDDAPKENGAKRLKTHHSPDRDDSETKADIDAEEPADAAGEGMADEAVAAEACKESLTEGGESADADSQASNGSSDSLLSSESDGHSAGGCCYGFILSKTITLVQYGFKYIYCHCLSKHILIIKTLLYM